MSLLHKKKLSHQPLPINTAVCNHRRPVTTPTLQPGSHPRSRDSASDSLLHCLESDAADKDSPFTNLYETDRRKCQICGDLFGPSTVQHRPSDFLRCRSMGACRLYSARLREESRSTAVHSTQHSRDRSSLSDEVAHLFALARKLGASGTAVRTNATNDSTATASRGTTLPSTRPSCSS